MPSYTLLRGRRSALARLPVSLRLNCMGLPGVIFMLAFLSGCAFTTASPAPVPSATSGTSQQALSEDEIATLSSLEQVDDYPLYTMYYYGVYSEPVLSAVGPGLSETAMLSDPNTCQACWGCTMFAALGDPSRRLYGRNFDWRFSPALLLFTDPPDGYASVSMVDIEYLGFGKDRVGSLLELSFGELRSLLDAPALPFDGLNERGLAIGMAAVPPGDMLRDLNKKTIGELAVMREILDHASTVEEAVSILASYNIDMGEVPLHYLIASAAGDSALVEFFQGEMVVFKNEPPWQQATNFLVAATGDRLQGQCWRYDRVRQQLQEVGGQMTIQGSMDLLADVSQGGAQVQSSTQWSIVYDMTGGSIHVVMGRRYADVHTFNLSLPGR